jgi:hypothetical protein
VVQCIFMMVHGGSVKFEAGQVTKLMIHTLNQISSLKIGGHVIKSMTEF